MSGDTLIVERHEHKFLISPKEAFCLNQAFNAILQHDKHAGTSGYYIRSLYFDTPDSKDYTEKILGVSERQKLRLRVYSLDDAMVKLEIKNKHGSTSVKETAMITRDEAESLIQGDYSALAHDTNPTIRKFINLLQIENRSPAVLIDYERDAFVCPAENVRMTFDRNIRSAKSTELFGENVPMLGLHSSAVTVLEVKYDRFLPHYLSGVLSCYTMQEQSISKYYTARAALY